MIKGNDVIIEQTKPQKSQINEEASKICSDVCEAFFPCFRNAYLSASQSFKRFEEYDKATILQVEVEKYVRIMQTNLLAGNTKELPFVQPEIRGEFWNKTKCCLHNMQNCVLVNEKSYKIRVENVNIKAKIVSGEIDHVIQLVDSDSLALTIEHKAIGTKISNQEVSQVVSQVEFAVSQMQKHLRYARAEYVGLLQTGDVWCAIRRRIFSEQVIAILFKHVQSITIIAQCPCRYSGRIRKHLLPLTVRMESAVRVAPRSRN